MFSTLHASSRLRPLLGTSNTATPLPTQYQMNHSFSNSEILPQQYVQLLEPTPVASSMSKSFWRKFTFLGVSIGIVLLFLVLFFEKSSSGGLEEIPSALQYRDTRVKSMSAPLVLESHSDWNYGNKIETTNAKNTHDQVRHLVIEPNNGAELLTDNKTYPVEYDNNSFLLQDDTKKRNSIEIANNNLTNYNQDKIKVDPLPIYFSDYTLRNLEGEDLKQRDDRMCSKAANYRNFDPEKCVGAPYLYVTYHGGRNSNRRIKNICKYTRNGCSLGSVLMPNSKYHPHSLRGMILERNFLFVAEAWRKDSKVLRFSHCNPSLGDRRELLQVLVDSSNSSDAGMLHPYGFAKRPEDPYIYVSAQGTYSVLRFHHSNGQPGPLPLALIGLDKNSTADMMMEDPEALKETTKDTKRRRQGQQPLRKYRLRKNGHKLSGVHNGTFVDLGNDEIRGIAFDSQGLLYVANKQKGVMVFDKNGYVLGQLPLNVPNPISIHYCKERDSIWVGSAKRHALYEYDATTWEVMQSIKHHRLLHPAGFVSYGDALYVVSQGMSQLLKFSMVTGQLENIVLPSLPDAGERILLSHC